MRITDDELQQLLLKAKLVTKSQFTKAVEGATAKHTAVEQVLADLKISTLSQIGPVIGKWYGVPYRDLSQQNIPEDILHLIPPIVCRKQGVVAFKKDSRGLWVAMSDPQNLDLIHLLRKKTGDELLIFYASDVEIAKTLERYQDTPQEEFSLRIHRYLDDLKRQITSSAVSGEEAPLIRIVEELLVYAQHNKASDIHIEPRENSVEVRFRIDGMLHDIVTLPKSINDLVVTRIKVMAKLRTDEHRAAQDGKLQFTSGSEKIDVRVSIIPIVNGEKVVMRLLSKQGRGFSLEELDFTVRDLSVIQKNIRKPWGMMLATGPTGSGKTTMLYAILKILNTRAVNISTIEDPVEYDVEGVNQIQVNPRTNLTFAAGLRSILRQDPNIIMVGEIRDEETAQIAVNAALTGHLVLSTLHTNDSATTLPRLLDMGVEPFLIASTINVAMGQRLVRKICQSCKVSSTIVVKELPQELLHAISKGLTKELTRTITVWKGKGCSVCHDTGYIGRIGIYEVLEMDEGIRALIMSRSDADHIRAQARAQGMTTLIEDGMRKVIEGFTTIEEVLRVTKE